MVALLFWGCASGAVAEEDARALLQCGKYAEAAEIYGKTADKDPQAALGLARCYRAQGKLDEAVKALQPLASNEASILAELAEMAFARGDYAKARSLADEAVRLDRRQLRAQWVAAEVNRVEGKLEEAGRGYKWFISYYNNNDVATAEALHYVGLAAAQYARWNRLADQFDFLVNELYPDALEVDPAYWPAHYEAGILLLEKYNEADAADELNKALTLNPAAAEVHAALARLALENRDIEKARRSVDRALEINPRLLAAWHVRADLLWANFEPEQAAELLEKHALPLCPVSEETLGRLAACYALVDGAGGGPESRLGRLIAEVNRRNPHAGDFYTTLAAALESRSKIALSERMFREAIKRMPQMVGPRSGLGMLYMRTGQEAEARRVLDEAFEVDPFNIRVNNTLEVLDVLDDMARLETGCLVLRYSRQEDELLAQQAAAELDACYPELCEQFGYRPPGKPLVEIFNQAKGADGHQWFSTRLVGLPYVGTVAASTGKMVAMLSPNEPDVKKQFNWYRVLRHELVHVITLQQTDFNCPHWFTEALAVWSERQPRPQEWNEILVRRVAAERIFNLQTINFGFIRPHSSDDWALAYCQAQLYLEYMLRIHGSGVIRRMLDAYAANLTTEEAISRVLGQSQAEFERGYAAYVKQLAGEMSSLGTPEERDFAEVKQQQEEKPDDPDLAAELALIFVRRGAKADAQRLAELAVKRSPKHQLAHYVLARLKIDADKPDEAIALVTFCLDEQNPEPHALNLLAGLELKAEHYTEAARLYELGRKHNPYNLKWTEALARVYLGSGNDEKLTEVLTELARCDGDDLAVRKKLARLALAKKDYAAAARWCGEALRIDVKDAEVRRTLAETEVARHNYPMAIRQFDLAIELDPKEPYLRMALADACVEGGQTEKARDVLEALLKVAPDYPGAAALLESLDDNPLPTPEAPGSAGGQSEPPTKPKP